MKEKSWKKTCKNLMNALVWPRYDKIIHLLPKFSMYISLKKCVYVKEYQSLGQAVLMRYLEGRKRMNLVSKNLGGLTSLQLTD